LCYDIKASLEAQLNRVKRRGDLQAIEEITEKLVPLTDLPIYHKSGFSHPELLIYTNRSPIFPEVATWGLVPSWIQNEEASKKLWNNTLNARGETIFEKPSFRDAATSQHCVVYIDGFYEHHHYKGKTYPFYIYDKSHKPLALAGLWNEWQNPVTGGTLNSFTLITSSGNDFMAKIHNNPKLTSARMPVILSPEEEEVWLTTTKDEHDLKEIKILIATAENKQLSAHTVSRLRGKAYLGNTSTVSDEVHYPELVF
jgi:putative SOS response-associated peptidase YedK